VVTGEVNHVKARLTSIFDVRDLGEARNFLGMSLDRQVRTLKMTQERLAAELVRKHGLKEGRTKSVPKAHQSGLCKLRRTSCWTDRSTTAVS